ncbi:MAG TPA: peptidoglycan-binding protein [Candidatus Paceibacterota bacterium]|nr:peptidoglycan-binding protein [Candidatus Paceibacterota bacterium]
MNLTRPFFLFLVAAALFMGAAHHAHAALLVSDLSIGSRGAEVTQLQLILFQFGYSTAAPNGVYSEATADGVRALQKKYGLPQTGIVDAKVRGFLNPFIARNPTSGSTRPASPTAGSVGGGTAALAFGARGAAVLELQQKLAALGYFKETPTGYFGPITRAAVAAFQAARGLETVGYVGPRTRAALAEVPTGTATAAGSGTSPRVSGTTTTGERPPALTFRIDRKFAIVGDYVYLSWSAKRADTCTASGAWSGDKGTKGSDALTVAGDATYTLTCTGSGGSVTKSVWVSTTLVARKAEEPEDVTSTPVAVTPPSSTPGSSAPPSPTPTPTPAPVPTPLPGPSKSYQVYPGCEAPARSYARVVYLDPRNGSEAGDGSAAAPLKTLATALAAKKLRAGDHVILMPGEHGAFVGDTSFSQKGLFFRDAPNWTWFDFQEGATISKSDLSGFSRILITNPEVTPGGILVTGGSQVVVADGEFYLARNTADWTAEKWLAQGKGNTLMSRNTRCVSFIDNELRNIPFGISISVDGLPTSDNSARALVARNTISRFRGDGIRPNGSDVIVRDNRIVDSMLGREHGDGNHDDGIQLFALNGHRFKNVRIENNWIQETTSATRPYIGTLQGIGHFDGVIEDVVVRNNVVLIGAYHGIMLNSVGGTVENNTVAYVGTEGRNTWIRMGASSQNITFRNNVARFFEYPTSAGRIQIRAPQQDAIGNNITVKDNESAAFMKFDPANGAFDLRPKPGGPLDGKGVGAAGLTSGLGSQAVLKDPSAQTAGAGNALPSLADLYEQLMNLLKTIR